MTIDPFPPLFAFAIAAALAHWFLRPDSPLHVLDHPNERSLHSRPVPRTGGVAVICAVVALAWLVPFEGLGWLVAGVLLLAATGLRDDFGHLAIRVRLLAQLLAVGLLLPAGWRVTSLPLPAPFVELPAVLGILLTLIGGVWMINLYNFMDGMDGLAGAMGVMGFGGLALLGALAGDLPLVQINLLIVAALLGFLVWNAPAARIFLGDAGASVLGFLAIALALAAEQRGVAPLWLGLALFSPFIFDATYTILRRQLRGARVWQAHREHLYQRLVTGGWSHRRTLAAACGLMLAVVAVVLAASRGGAGGQWLALMLLAALYALLAVLVERRAGRAG